SGINLSLSEGALISAADGQILIHLKEGHRPTPEYVRKLRAALNEKYPSTTFFFLAPDISTQVLNFGLPAPISVQVVGAIGNEDQTYAVAEKLAERMKKIPGAADVHLPQVQRVPQIQIDVDRTKAGQAGLSTRDVANDVLVSLSSSGQVSPTYWLDKRGVQYLVSVQTPQYKMNSLEAVDSTPLSRGHGTPQGPGDVAQLSRTSGPANVTHYNVRQT